MQITNVNTKSFNLNILNLVKLHFIKNLDNFRPDPGYLEE
jgi:hypothetical protein